MAVNTSVSTPPSPSPTPSDATAPLLVSEDLHSLSSSDEATSDWSSHSDGDGGDVSEAEEEDFDLLASQELRQLPSDASSNSTTSSNSAGERRRDLGSTGGSRMTLSFPDPFDTSTASPAATDSEEGGDVNPPFSPAPSSGAKVRADLDNSILADGGSYSLLLDAPPSSSSPTTAAQLVSDEEGDTTSTPPPAVVGSAPSPRPSFLRSHTSTPSSSSIIVRAKPGSPPLFSSTITSTTAAAETENKVDKWRSSLASVLPPSVEKGSGRQGRLSVEASTTDLSSVHSSQTVVPALHDSDCSSRILDRSSNISFSALNASEKTSSGGEGGGRGGECEEKGKKLDSNLRSNLDRIASSPSPSRALSPWLNRIMLGLTIAGVALVVGAGTLQVLNGNLLSTLGPHRHAESRVALSASSGQVLRTETGAADVPVSEQKREEEEESNVFSTSRLGLDNLVVLNHTLPTATPPISLAPSPRSSLSSPHSSNSATPSPARIAAGPTPSSIDPPFALVLESTSGSNVASTDSLNVKEEAIDVTDQTLIDLVEEEEEEGLEFDTLTTTDADDEGTDARQGGGRRMSLSSSSRVAPRTNLHEMLKDKMLQHAKRCRKVETRVLSRIERVTGYDGRKARRRMRKQVRAVIALAGGGSGGENAKSEKFTPGGREDQQLEFAADETLEEREDGGGGGGGGGVSTILRDAWSLLESFEQKLEARVKEVVHDVQQHRDRHIVHRLTRYPTVRDYYRSTKEQVIARGGGAKTEIGRVWKDVGAKGKAEHVLALMKQQAVGIQHKLVELENGNGAQVLGKQWRKAIAKGEKHVKRAARAVKKLEKRDHWQVRRDEKKQTRERRRQRKRA